MSYKTLIASMNQRKSSERALDMAESLASGLTRISLAQQGGQQMQIVYAECCASAENYAIESKEIGKQMADMQAEYLKPLVIAFNFANTPRHKQCMQHKYTRNLHLWKRISAPVKEPT